MLVNLIPQLSWQGPAWISPEIAKTRMGCLYSHEWKDPMLWQLLRRLLGLLPGLGVVLFLGGPVIF